MARLAIVARLSRGAAGFHRLVAALHRKQLTVVSLMYVDDGGEQVLVAELDVHARDADVALAALQREPLVVSVRALALRQGTMHELLSAVRAADCCEASRRSRAASAD